MERRGPKPVRVVGRYAMFDVIAMGGMATVHFGRLLGPAGFSRAVVIKRLHAQYAGDPEIAAMFLDEARVAARIRHTNVVTVIDVVKDGPEIFLVMEYVHGESLAYLLRSDPGHSVERTRLVGNVVASALLGLHAAHEVTGENNRPLGVVHRDFSPQNIVVGVDGAARVLDFGVAKAAGQTHHTDVGKVKGKIRYLAPEQVTCGELDRRTDLWAASVVLWEALTGRRLFSGEHDASVLRQVLDRPICSPRDLAPEVPEALAQVVMRGLSRDRKRRFATALEMATALEQAVGLVAPREVGAWVERLAHGNLEERRRALAEIEAAPLFAPRPSLPENATITDTAMVRVSSPEPERPTFTEPAARRARLSTRPSYDRAPSRRPFPRATALAWGAAATLVVAIGGGVGGRLLSRMPVQIVVTPAAATLPSTTLVDTLVISAEPMGLSPAPEPTVETAALPVPSASARALPSHRARPALSRTRGAQVTAAPPETPKPPAQPVASTPVDLAHAPFIGRE